MCRNIWTFRNIWKFQRRCSFSFFTKCFIDNKINANFYREEKDVKGMISTILHAWKEQVFITGCHRHQRGLQNLRGGKKKQHHHNRINLENRKPHTVSLSRACIEYVQDFSSLKTSVQVWVFFFVFLPLALFRFAVHMKLVSCDTCSARFSHCRRKHDFKTWSRVALEPTRPRKTGYTRRGSASALHFYSLPLWLVSETRLKHSHCCSVAVIR